ncbi:MAG: murein biosynthesis integral membrane protein MurJ [Planctomycetes bacterium]|nr:murein biosynthesis integral membrane protein MurJ [Planctomycetota bacterium]
MPSAAEIQATGSADARPSSALARNSFLVAICTGLSRILGYVRDSALGALFGTSPTYEALRLAFSIPNFLRRLFGEGALTAVFLPMFQRARQRGGDIEARETVAIVGGTQLAVLLTLAFAGSAICIFTPPSVLAGFLTENPERAPLLLKYLTILIPYLVPVCLYAFAMAILNARAKFFVPAIAPFFQNIVALLSFVVAWGVAFGFKKPNIAEDAERFDLAAQIVAGGFLSGGIIMFLIQLPSLRAEGMLVCPKLQISHPLFREFAKNLLPMALSLGAVQLSVFLSTVIAFTIVAHGANIHLDYAARIFQLPQGIVGSAVATAAFPHLAKSWHEKKYHEVRTELDRGLGLAVFLGAAASAGLLALAHPIVTVLYGYGNFDEVACGETSKALTAFAISIPFLTAVPLLARIFYASGNTRTPSYVAAALIATDCGGAYLLAKPFGVAGIAAATTVTAILNCVILSVLLRKSPMPKSPALGFRLLKIAFAAVACGAGAFATRFAFEQLLRSPLRIALVAEVAFSVVAGAASLAAVARWMNLEEFGELTALARRRKRAN